MIAGWARASAWAAPIVLTLGFVLGAAQQPAGYSWVFQTISALANGEARAPWIMATSFVLLGLCHLVTALALRNAVLALGGVAIVLVAVFPEPPHALIHSTVAAVAFIAMAVWPLWSIADAPAVLRAKVAWSASIALLALLCWFGLSCFFPLLQGIAERITAVAESVWPLVVVESLRRHGAQVLRPRHERASGEH